MNIVCIGYYDKFSRFFDIVKQNIEKEQSVSEFSVLNMYLSGALYQWVRFRKSQWISFDAWFLSRRKRKEYSGILKKSHIYKNFDLEKLVAAIYNSEKHQPEALLLQAMAYIDLLQKYLEKADVLIMIGDARIPFEISIEIAKSKTIPIYHIEQGPYSTTFIDAKGVNANAGIRGYAPRDKEDPVKKDEVAKHIAQIPLKKYVRNPLYRGLDYILEFILTKTSFFPPDLKVNNPLFSKVKRKSSVKIYDVDQHTDMKIFLLILQVPFDVNMTHHSPFYHNHFDILKDVHRHLPEKSILVVREHPVYKGKYEDKLYDYISYSDNIYMDLNKDFSKVLNKSDVVIVNNSTVGLEAIAKQKSVVVLGNSYYDLSNICLKLNDKSELKKLLANAVDYRPNENMIQDFMHYFFTRQTVKGSITDEKNLAAQYISKKILTEFKS